MRMMAWLAIWGPILLVSASCSSQSSTAAPASPAVQSSPATSAALTRFRTQFGVDANAVDAAYNRAGLCNSRDSCIAALGAARDLTVALENYVEATPPPPEIAKFIPEVKRAVADFVDQLNAAIARMSDSNYSAVANTPNIIHLDQAVGEVDCWPASPVPFGAEGASVGC